MTTKVTVENNAGSRCKVRVIQVEFDKGKTGSRDTQQQEIQPGHRAEFYVYTLRDLRIEEIADHD